MKKPSTNSKTFWQDDHLLETKMQRKKIEYLVEREKEKNSKFSSKVRKFFRDLF